MPKPPLPTNEPERLAALARYYILDTPPEPAFDDITRLVARICQTPIALVTFIEGDRQWIKSRIGFKPTQLPRDAVFCSHTILQNDLLVVADAQTDPRFAGALLVAHPPHIRFYAGATLSTSDGFALGTLCVLDLAPRELTPHQMDALRVLSRQVMAQLELRARTQSLGEATLARDQLAGELQATASLLQEAAAARQQLDGELRATAASLFEASAARQQLESEKHQAEAGQQKFSALVENSSDFIGMASLDGQMIYLNRAGRTLVGWDGAADLQSVRLHDFVAEADLPDFHERIAPAVLQDGQWAGELRFKHFQTGLALRMHYSAFLIKHPRTGEPIAIASISRDLTERNQVEDALRQSEARARLLLDAFPDMLFRLSSDGRFVDFKADPKDLLLPPEQFLGRHYGEVLPQHVCDLTEAAIQRAQATGSIQTFEYELMLPNGRAGYFEGRLSAGAESSVIVTIRNITERRRAEDALRESEGRFRQLAQAIHQVFWITSADQSQMIYVSPAYETIWGRDPQGLYDDPRAFIDAIHPDDRDRIIAAQPRRAQGDYDVRYRIIRPDGSLRWIRSVAFPVRDGNGEIYRVAGVSEDITEQKESEIALRGQKQLFENLVAVARATAERPTLEATLQNALDVSVALTSATRGSLFLLDAAGEVTHSILSTGHEFASSRHDLVAQVMKSGLAGWVAGNRQTTLIDDTLVDQRWLGPPDMEYSTRSVLAVPIVHGEALVGILTLLHIEPRHFTADHLSLMQAAADQVALALRNAQIFDQARRQAAEMYMLNSITQASLEASDFDGMLQVLAERVGDLLGADGCCVTLWDEAGQKAQPAAASGNLRDSCRSLQVEPGEAAMTDSVLAAGHALAAEDVFNTPYLSRRIAEMLPARSLLGLPLIARGQKLGATLISFDSQHHFTPHEMTLGEQAARQIALAISNAMLYKTIAEESGRLQSLIESSRDGVVLIGLDRRTLVINAPAMHLLGLPGKPEEWIGRPLQEGLDALSKHAPHVVDVTLAELRRIQRGDETPAEGEYEIQSKVIHWINLPVLANRVPLGRLLVLRDVTEERTLEKMRDDVTHMMVHDLRSPLTAIIGAVDLLREMERAEPAKELEVIELIHDGTEHMLSLVNAILDVSQLESRQIPVERVQVQLSALVGEVLQLQSGLAEKKQISLENGVSAELPLLWADGRLVERILQNLVGNALMFTPAGGVIRITAAPGPSAPSMVEVSVSDTGPGIPAEIQGRLFQKFVTGPQTGHGNGLGLAFCRLAVEAHGGNIWAKSEPGQGSTFTFTLPLHQDGD